MNVQMAAVTCGHPGQLQIILTQFHIRLGPTFTYSQWFYFFPNLYLAKSTCLHALSTTCPAIADNPRDNCCASVAHIVYEQRGCLADRSLLMLAPMLQCCDRRRRLSSVTLCTVTKRCILQQKLLLAACRKSYNEKSIGTKMNDLDRCLEVV